MEILLRPLTNLDYDQIYQVECLTWPPQCRYKPEEIKTQLKLFPEGFLGIFKKNTLIGFAHGIRIKEYQHFKTWEQASSLSNYNPSGKNIYLTNVAVSQKGGGIGTILIHSYKLYAKENLGIKKLILGSRIPTENFYARCGFNVIERIKDWWVIDTESNGEGVLMSCELK